MFTEKRNIIYNIWAENRSILAIFSRGVIQMTTKPNREVRHIRDFKDMLEQSTKLYGDNEAFYIKSDDGTYKGIKYR